MAVRQLPDGRWICYYKEGGHVKKEYFGRGCSAWRDVPVHNDFLPE